IEVNNDCGAPSPYALITPALPTLTRKPIPRASHNVFVLSAILFCGEVIRYITSITKNPIAEAYALIRKGDTSLGKSLEMDWYITKRSGTPMASICHVMTPY